MSTTSITDHKGKEWQVNVNCNYIPKTDVTEIPLFDQKTIAYWTDLLFPILQKMPEFSANNSINNIQEMAKDTNIQVVNHDTPTHTHEVFMQNGRPIKGVMTPKNPKPTTKTNSQL